MDTAVIPIVVWIACIAAIIGTAAATADKGYAKGLADKQAETLQYGHVLIDWREPIGRDFDAWMNSLPATAAAIIWVAACAAATVVSAMIPSPGGSAFMVWCCTIIGAICAACSIPCILETTKHKFRFDYNEAKGMHYHTNPGTGERFRIIHQAADGKCQCSTTPYELRLRDEHQLNAQNREAKQEMEAKLPIALFSCLGMFVAALFGGTLGFGWMIFFLYCAIFVAACVLSVILPRWKVIELREHALATASYVRGAKVHDPAPVRMTTNTIQQQKTYGAARFATDDEAIRGLGA